MIEATPVIIKMPKAEVHSWFGKKKVVYTDIDVKFLFRLITLELVCEELDIEFYDLFEKKDINGKEMSSSLIYCAYVAACCREYTKPVYTKEDAEFWNEYMSQSSRDAYIKCMNEFIGRLPQGQPEQTEKKK